MTSKPPSDPPPPRTPGPRAVSARPNRPVPTLTEEDVQAYRRGDRLALKRLYMVVIDDLAKLTRKYFPNRADAFDALEDGYTRLYDNHARFEGDAEGWRGWAWKTTELAVMNLLRLRAVRTRVEVADGEEHEPAPVTTAIHVPLPEDPEAQAFAREHFRRLKLRHRRVIELWLEDRTDVEIAAILADEESTPKHREIVTVGKVRMRRNRAFAQLKRSLRVLFPDEGAAGPMDLGSLVSRFHDNLMEDPVADEIARLRQKVAELTEALGMETWRVGRIERQWKADVERLEKERDAALARVGGAEEGGKE